jgi:hypothetical protein
MVMHFHNVVCGLSCAVHLTKGMAREQASSEVKTLVGAQTIYNHKPLDEDQVGAFFIFCQYSTYNTREKHTLMLITTDHGPHVLCRRRRSLREADLHRTVKARGIARELGECMR